MTCEIYQPKAWTDDQMLPIGKHRVCPAALQMAREYRGLSQGEAAQKLDITLARIRALESGASPATKAELARAAMVYHFPLVFFQRQIEWANQAPGPFFICGDGPFQSCSRCGYGSSLLCDYPIGGGETCDLPLCDRCAVEQMPSMERADGSVSDSIDYCPQHALMAQGLVLTEEAS